MELLLLLLDNGFEIERTDAVGRPVSRIGIHTIVVKDDQRFAVSGIEHGPGRIAIRMQAIDAGGNDLHQHIEIERPAGRNE